MCGGVELGRVAPSEEEEWGALGTAGALCLHGKTFPLPSWYLFAFLCFHESLPAWLFHVGSSLHQEQSFRVGDPTRVGKDLGPHPTNTFLS